MAAVRLGRTPAILVREAVGPRLSSIGRPAAPGRAATGFSGRPPGPGPVRIAPGAIMGGTLPPAGEPLQRLPPAEARPWTWVEPIRLTASSTPGQTLPKRGCSAKTAPGTAAPTRKTPSAGLFNGPPLAAFFVFDIPPT